MLGRGGSRGQKDRAAGMGGVHAAVAVSSARVAVPAGRPRRLEAIPGSGVNADGSRKTEHFPIRPSWRCQWCAKPWPCENRRQQLLVDYANAPASLTLMMLDEMVRAMVDEDIARMTSGAVRRRFIGWIEEARAVEAARRRIAPYLTDRMTQGRRR